jgi:hypothetical protein
MQWNTIAGTSYIWSSILIKLSIGFYILRIIPKLPSSAASTRKRSRRRTICLFVMLFSTGVNILHFIYRLVFCRSTTNYYKTIAAASTSTASSPTASHSLSPPSMEAVDIIDVNVTNDRSLTQINAEGFCAVQDSAHLAMVFIAATVNILADIAYICLPLPEMLRGLKQRRYHKLVFVVFIFAAA